jgi:hypothetical protein
LEPEMVNTPLFKWSFVNGEAVPIPKLPLDARMRARSTLLVLNTASKMLLDPKNWVGLGETPLKILFAIVDCACIVMEIPKDIIRDITK